jgi:hypothetical protein
MYCSVPVGEARSFWSLRVRVAGSGRSRDLEAHGPSGGRHPIVVRDNLAQVGSEAAGDGQMNGVERPNFLGQKRSGDGHNPVVDAYEVDPNENPAAGDQSGPASVEQCPAYLGASQPTGDEGPAPLDVPSESVRFRLRTASFTMAEESRYVAATLTARNGAAFEGRWSGTPHCSAASGAQEGRRCRLRPSRSRRMNASVRAGSPQVAGRAWPGRPRSVISTVSPCPTSPRSSLARCRSSRTPTDVIGVRSTSTPAWPLPPVVHVRCQGPRLHEVGADGLRRRYPAPRALHPTMVAPRNPRATSTKAGAVP